MNSYTRGTQPRMSEHFHIQRVKQHWEIPSTPCRFLRKPTRVLFDAGTEEIESMGNKTPKYTARKITEADLSSLQEATGGDESHRIKPGGRSYHPKNCIIVVEEAGAIIGSIFVVFVRPPRWTDADDTSRLPQMISLIINEDRRNQGAGTYLIGAVEEEVKSRGLTNLYLAVDREDSGAQRLYKRLGFKTIPTEPYTTSWTWTDSDGVVQKETVWLVDMMMKLS